MHGNAIIKYLHWTDRENNLHSCQFVKQNTLHLNLPINEIKIYIKILIINRILTHNHVLYFNIK